MFFLTKPVRVCEERRREQAGRGESMIRVGVMNKGIRRKRGER